MSTIFPSFRQVRVFVDSGQKSLRRHAILGDKYGTTDVRERGVTIKISSGVSILAKKASSGLLLALAHLSLVYANPEGSLLLLEEPENGLNETIMLAMMRSFLDAVRSRDQQLIMTTHHAWWLDLVPHDSLRVVTRDEDGGHVEAPLPGEIRRIVEEKNLYPSEVMSMGGPESLLAIGRKKPRG